MNESKLKAAAMDSVGELPAGYPHLPTTPIKPKSDAWNDAGTKPDHPCLCETKLEGLDDFYFQYFNGDSFCFACGTQDHAIRWAHLNKPRFKVIQWREVQP